MRLVSAESVIFPLTSPNVASDSLEQKTIELLICKFCLIFVIFVVLMTKVRQT